MLVKVDYLMKVILCCVYVILENIFIYFNDGYWKFGNFKGGKGAVLEGKYIIG